MQSSRFSALLQHGRMGRLTGAFILAFGLLGCSQQPSQKVASRADITLNEPDVKIVDYQLVSCEHIWAFNDRPQR